MRQSAVTAGGYPGAGPWPILSSSLRVCGQEFQINLATVVRVPRVAPPRALPVRGPVHRIDVDNVQPTYRNGVLTVTLPNPEDSTGRRIAVQGGSGHLGPGPSRRGDIDE